jgi:hypothetical protein
VKLKFKTLHWCCICIALLLLTAGFIVAGIVDSYTCRIRDLSLLDKLIVALLVVALVHIAVVSVVLLIYSLYVVSHGGECARTQN